MDYLQVAHDLAAHVRQAVRPLIGRPESRGIVRTAMSGDATFAIDEAAEDAVVGFIRQRDLNVAYYTEDAGLRTFTDPEAVLVVDPIDGTRGAAAGLECCGVAVAIADYKPTAKMRDVRASCFYEIKHDRVFLAARHGGVTVLEDGDQVLHRKADIQDIASAAWSAEIAGRPAELVGRVLADAIDRSSVRGGFFVLNSSAYSLTRMVTGQFAAMVDVGPRIVADAPRTRPRFLEAGGGTVIGAFPYDFAAAALIAEEAGCVVTDAYGRSLDAIDLLDSSERNMHSLVAACCPALHRAFLASIERGIARLLI